MRGSTPAPGAEFVRVGGHTSCLAVWPDGQDRPRLVLDAGTGIREVTGLLGGAPFDGSVLLSHLHWDHVQGLPFFAAADRPGARTHLWLPADGPEEAELVLARAMSPPHFPIGPDGLRGGWTFSSLAEGWTTIEGVRVLARRVPHKGGRTYGYRLEEGGRSLAYLPDHLPATRPTDGVSRLVEGVDVLVHDAQFLLRERAVATAYGHATIDEAIRLATELGARRLVLFHHAPTRTDDELERIACTVARHSRIPVCLAVEGLEIEL